MEDGGWTFFFLGDDLIETVFGEGIGRYGNCDVCWFL